MRLRGGRGGGIDAVLVSMKVSTPDCGRQEGGVRRVERECEASTERNREKERERRLEKESEREIQAE